MLQILNKIVYLANFYQKYDVFAGFVDKYACYYASYVYWMQGMNSLSQTT